jgi:ribosomal protein S4E
MKLKITRILKTFTAPKKWGRLRVKTKKYFVRPKLSGYPRQFCLPISVILVDKLKLFDTAHQLKAFLNRGHVKINGVIIKDRKHVVGLGETLEAREKGNFHLTLSPHDKILKLQKIDTCDSYYYSAHIQPSKNIFSRWGGKIFTINNAAKDTLYQVDNKNNIAKYVGEVHKTQVLFKNKIFYITLPIIYTK